MEGHPAWTLIIARLCETTSCTSWAIRSRSRSTSSRRCCSSRTALSARRRRLAPTATPTATNTTTQANGSGTASSRVRRPPTASAPAQTRTSTAPRATAEGQRIRVDTCRPPPRRCPSPVRAAFEGIAARRRPPRPRHRSGPLPPRMSASDARGRSRSGAAGPACRRAPSQASRTPTSREYRITARGRTISQERHGRRYPPQRGSSSAFRRTFRSYAHGSSRHYGRAPMFSPEDPPRVVVNSRCSRAAACSRPGSCRSVSSTGGHRRTTFAAVPLDVPSCSARSYEEQRPSCRPDGQCVGASVWYALTFGQARWAAAVPRCWR